MKAFGPFVVVVAVVMLESLAGLMELKAGNSAEFVDTKAKEDDQNEMNLMEKLLLVK